MPSRRPHTKTRHGCNTCKARKVRCDEEKPVCRNCTRGSRNCSYSEQIFAFPTHDPSTKNAVFPVRDMELLHHYTAFSCRVMTHEEAQDVLWRVEVPRLAFGHRFLLHGLLAVSAMHKRVWADTEQQKMSLMDVARYHQQHALTLYIPLLRSIDRENCHAMFGFSVVLATITFAMLVGNNQHHAFVAQFLELIDTLMGCTAVAYEAKDMLCHGPFNFVIDMLNFDANNHANLCQDPKEALEALIQAAERVCEDSSLSAQEAATRHNAYISAIRTLGSVYAPPASDRHLSVVVSWPVMAGHDYIVLLKQRDSLAMVILAHYGVGLHLYGDHKWMLQGLGKRLTQAVADEVDPKWRPYLSWAESRVAAPVTQPVTPI